MRTIITLKSGANGKTRVTRDHFITVKRYAGGYVLYEGAGTDGGSWLVKGNGGERKKYDNRQDAEMHIEASLSAQGYDRAYRGRDTYENGLTSKEDELIAKGFKHVSTGNNGWTKVYENDAGKRVTIEFGPQPGQIRSISKDASDPESAGKWSEVKNSEGKTVRVWVPSKKTASEAAGEAKDLFIGNRGLSMERSEGFMDHAYTGDRRRVVIHNHLPRANDASGVAQYYLVAAWVTEPHWKEEHIARDRVLAQSEESALEKAKAKFIARGMTVVSIWIGT